MKVKPLSIGIQIDCDIANLTEQDYNDINDLYLEHLIVVFKNQPFQTLPFTKLIAKMGHFANSEQMLWKRNGENTGKGKHKSHSLTPRGDSKRDSPGRSARQNGSWGRR